MNIKTIGFIIGLGLAVSACQKPSQTTVVLPDGVGIYEPQDIPLIEKGRLSKEDRVHSATNLFQTLKDNYVLWPFKKSTVGVNPEQVAQKCINTESKISGSSYRSDFVDRLTACLSELKDSHLNLNTVIKRARVIGLIGELAEVKGKIYIASVRKDLIDHAVQTYPSLSPISNLLVPGTEVLYIDGKLSSLALADFQKYISGSTELAARKEALFRFFQRNVAYPKSQSLKLVVQTQSGKKESLTIPWYYSAAADLESDVLLGERKLSDNQALGVSAKTSGFWAGDPVYSSNELTDQSQYYVDPGQQEEFLNFGFLKSNPKTCYMKVSTFNLSNKKTYSGNNQLPMEASMVIEQLLKRCEAADAELILDLNYNEGGDIEVGKYLLSALLPEDVEAKILRSFTTAKNVWEVVNVFRIWSQEDPTFLQQYEALRDAFQSNRPTTDWIVRDVGTEISGIFSGKLTVIISPSCVSACDALATGLKRAKRGTLIGEPANGTGAGFLSVNKSSYTYTDANNLFRVSIPNQLFSVVINSTQEPTLPFNENDILEGRPATPDIPYSLTLKDITNNFADLKAQLNK